MASTTVESRSGTRSVPAIKDQQKDGANQKTETGCSDALKARLSKLVSKYSSNSTANDPLLEGFIHTALDTALGYLSSALQASQKDPTQISWLLSNDQNDATVSRLRVEKTSWHLNLLLYRGDELKPRVIACIEAANEGWELVSLITNDPEITNLYLNIPVKCSYPAVKPPGFEPLYSDLLRDR